MRGTVSQPAPYFRASHEVEVRGPHGSIVVLEIAGARSSCNSSVPFQANTVTLDHIIECCVGRQSFALSSAAPQKQDELAGTRGPVLPDERRIRTAEEVHRGARSTKALHQIRGRNRGGFHFFSRDCGQEAIDVNNSGGGRG